MRPPARRAFVALLLLLVVLPATPAGAHAVLVSTSPGDGAALERAPEEVVLEFNEPVSADLGGLQVFDADGTRVDEGAVRVVDRTVAVDVGPLADGAYVASYRVVSSDGHPIQGGFTFTVGEGVDASGLDRLIAEDDGRGWETAQRVDRWLAMAGALVAVGGVAFLALCHRDAGAWADGLLRAGVVVGVVGMVLAVPVQAALATGQGARAIVQDGVLRAVLRDGWGPSVVLGVGGLLLVAATARRLPALAVVGSVAVVASFPLVGHTRVDDVLVASVADAVHVAAAAVWTGGLAFLLLGRRRIDDPATQARVTGRFSSVATAAIVLVGVAGAALSWTQVRSVDVLTSTGYGQLLLAKVATVGVVALLGAYNHFRLVPAAVAHPDDPRAGRRLSRTIGLELVGVAVAVAMTAVLVDVTPARASISRIHAEVLDLGDDLQVQLVVDPNRTGRNSVHLYLYDPRRRSAELDPDVRLELRKPGDGIGPITREPFRAGPAHYQWDGTELVSSGRWEVTVVVRLDRFTEASATADVLVG